MENLTTLPPDISTHWSAIAPLLTIRNEEEYEQAIERLNDLIDEIGTNEQHPLYNLLDTLGTLLIENILTKTREMNNHLLDMRFYWSLTIMLGNLLTLLKNMIITAGGRSCQKGRRYRSSNRN